MVPKELKALPLRNLSEILPTEGIYHPWYIDPYMLYFNDSSLRLILTMTTSNKEQSYVMLQPTQKEGCIDEPVSDLRPDGYQIICF